MSNWKSAAVNSGEYDYFVFDDFPAERIPAIYKQFMGCQAEFTVTDKYFPKMTIVNPFPRPSIFLFNTPEWEKATALLDMAWVRENIIEIMVFDKLY